MIDFINVTPDEAACTGFLKRLAVRDAALWTPDGEIQNAIRNRLGWLDAAAFIDKHAAWIDEFAQRIRAEGYQQAVLLGMGGSSLAPEVYAGVFGDRGLALTIADSTSPRQVRSITENCERADTLFIVSSKSGTTAETSALDAHFFAWARERFEAPERHFIAVTDPGSPLQSLAEERGYRETFLNPPDIGGRFSALSFFGLVPASLAGVDLAALRTHVPDSVADSCLAADACRLGLVLGTLARAGRNKLTLQPGASLAPVAAWIEQLIDESTGKDGKGIVTVPREPRLEPAAYGPDRVFVVMTLAGEPLDDAWVDAVAAAGHPVLRWEVRDLDRLGAEFYRWELATAAAGWILGVNPFDEPDVNDSKARTRGFLENPGPGIHDDASQPTRALKDLLDGARPGDYLAVLAYLPPSPAVRRRLEAWCDRLGRHTGLPCCLGFGPRYLHSSGQLHKGGPDQGLFIVLTLDTDTDVPIPGQQHGFKTLIEAQAHGDLQVLKERGRRVAHLRLRSTDDDLKVPE